MRKKTVLRTVLWYVLKLEDEKKRRRQVYYKILKGEPLNQYEIDLLAASLRDTDTYIFMLGDYIRGGKSYR
jgi:hypothetical protein